MAPEVEVRAVDTAAHEVGAELHSTRTERETETVEGVCILAWDVTHEKRRSGWTAAERTLTTVEVHDYDAARVELQRRGIGVGALTHKRGEVA